ncbi:MAG: hypothetical protein ACLTCQ_28135 [Enterocloster bolteae]
MVFSSLEFVFRFLPVFLVIYYIVPGRWKKSLAFYGEPGFLFLRSKRHSVLFCASGIIHPGQLSDWNSDWKVQNPQISGKRWLVYGVIYNLFWLILFKYAGFTHSESEPAFKYVENTCKMAGHCPGPACGN